MTAQKREIDQTENIVDTVVMFGDAECPTQLRASGASVCVREFANCIGRNASDFAAYFKCPGFDRLCVSLEISRAAFDKFFVC